MEHCYSQYRLLHLMFIRLVRTQATVLLLLSRFSHVWPTLWDSIDGSPPGSSVPGFSRQEHWSGLPFPSPMNACMLSRFSRVQLCATPWIVAHQAPLSMGFSRQEHWGGLPSPPPQAAVVFIILTLTAASCWWADQRSYFLLALTVIYLRLLGQPQDLDLTTFE